MTVPIVLVITAILAESLVFAQLPILGVAAPITLAVLLWLATKERILSLFVLVISAGMLLDILRPQYFVYTFTITFIFLGSLIALWQFLVSEFKYKPGTVRLTFIQLNAVSTIVFVGVPGFIVRSGISAIAVLQLTLISFVMVTIMSGSMLLLSRRYG